MRPSRLSALMTLASKTQETPYLLSLEMHGPSEHNARYLQQEHVETVEWPVSRPPSLSVCDRSNAPQLEQPACPTPRLLTRASLRGLECILPLLCVWFCLLLAALISRLRAPHKPDGNVPLLVRISVKFFVVCIDRPLRYEGELRKNCRVPLDNVLLRKRQSENSPLRDGFALPEHVSRLSGSCRICRVGRTRYPGRTLPTRRSAE